MGQSSSRSSTTRGFDDGGGYTETEAPLPTSQLRFHPMCGENIQLTRNRTVAKRVDSFCKGVVFSSRAVRINEKVRVKFVEYGRTWSGSLRYGFTSNSPDDVQHRSELPKYACPDMTGKPGSWAKALSENNNSVLEGTTLTFWVTQAGDVMYQLGGVDKGLCLSGVNTSRPLWAVFDCYGNAIAIEITGASEGVDTLPPSLSRLSLTPQPSTPPMSSSSSRTLSSPASGALCQFYAQSLLTPLQLHQTRGSNVRLSHNATQATRHTDSYCNGYVFTSRPLRPGERLVVKVLATEASYCGDMAFGLTNCNPSSLAGQALPDDSNQLLDRPEYWLVNKDVVVNAQTNDEIAFLITETGEVQFTRNGGTSTSIMYVDYTQTLWMFLDLYGRTQKIAVLGSIPALSNSGGEMRVAPHRHTTHRSISDHYLPSGRQLPRPPSAASLPPPPPPPRSSHAMPPVTPSSLTGSSRPPLSSTVSLPSGTGDTAGGAGDAGGSGGVSECVVCYERAVNSVLYNCGHMSLCYECARAQLLCSGICPICRATILDVIKIFKS